MKAKDLRNSLKCDNCHEELMIDDGAIAICYHCGRAFKIGLVVTLTYLPDYPIYESPWPDDRDDWSLSLPDLLSDDDDDDDFDDRLAQAVLDS